MFVSLVCIVLYVQMVSSTFEENKISNIYLSIWAEFEDKIKHILLYSIKKRSGHNFILLLNGCIHYIGHAGKSA